MVRILTFALVTTALAGCALDRLRRRSRAAGCRGDRAPRRRRRPRPQIGTFGFDTRRHGHAASARRRFLRFANGTWAKNTPIPADKSNYGSFTVLQDLSQQRARDILDAAKDDPEQRDRHRLCELPRRGGGRGQGPGADRAVARRDPRAQEPRRLCSSAAAGRAQRRRPACSLAASARTTATAMSISPVSARPASACPTATCICSMSRISSRCARPISTI